MTTRDIPGYRLLQRLDGPPHGSCWYAVRDADAGPALVIVNDVPYQDAIALEAARALAREAQRLDPARLRTPREVIALPDRLAVALDASRAELGQRAMLRLAQRLGLSLRRAPQEAARLALALIRALAPLAPHADHCDADRVLLGADGRLRFDPVRAPLITRANILGRVSGPIMALDDLPPEVARAQPLDARGHVFFVGVALYRFGVGGAPRQPRAGEFQRYQDVLESVFHPDTARLRATAPGLAEVAARATASDPEARYPGLEALARALHAQAAACEDTFPAYDAPAPSSPAQLLEGLRASLNAGHLSAALAHLDLASAEVYAHPAVRDYVRHHVQSAQLDAVVDDLYTPRADTQRPLDWAALHLAAQHPAVRARLLADSLGRAEAEAEAPRARLSLWAAGRQPMAPEAAPLPAADAPGDLGGLLLDAPPVPLGAVGLARCAKRWDDLREDGPDANVRACDACGQRVTRVERIGDLIGLAGSCAHIPRAALDPAPPARLGPTVAADDDTPPAAPASEAPLPGDWGGGLTGAVVDPLGPSALLEPPPSPRSPPKAAPDAAAAAPKRTLRQRLRDWWGR